MLAHPRRNSTRPWPERHSVFAAMTQCGATRAREPSLRKQVLGRSATPLKVGSVSVMWQRALVTGASEGIGRAMAKQLAAEGTNLVVVARDRSRLESLATEVDVSVEVLVADLGDADQLRVVEDRLSSAEDPVDLLVNNAGFGNTGDFWDLGVDAETAVLKVNCLAILRLSHAAAGAMRTNGRGGILNVSSVAAFVPSSRGTTYGATKAFVSSFSEGLHLALKDYGIHVTALHPGFTRTEFQDRASYDTSHLPDAVWQSAGDVARIGLEAVKKNKATVTSGLQNKVSASFLKSIPGVARRGITSALDNR